MFAVNRSPLCRGTLYVTILALGCCAALSGCETSSRGLSLASLPRDEPALIAGPQDGQGSFTTDAIAVSGGVGLAITCLGSGSATVSLGGGASVTAQCASAGAGATPIAWAGFPAAASHGSHALVVSSTSGTSRWRVAAYNLAYPLPGFPGI
jgi:hypothetical protein